MLPNPACVLLFVALIHCAAPAHSFSIQSGDVIIRNGQVIDGTGGPAVRADVLVRGDKIVEVGDLGESFPDGVVVHDAEGCAVTPGFIDTHSHGDPIGKPDLHNFLAMGVTTVCLGQDGDSTPVASLKAFFEKTAAAGPGANVLTFIGHGAVRKESGVGLSAQPSPEQLQSMEKLVREALDLGAFGLTTGLEYQPGSFSKPEELAVIAKPVGDRGLVVMSHMRNEDDDQLTTSIAELIEQCRAAGAQAHVSHIKSVYGKGAARAEEILSVLEAGRRSGVPVTADIYPYAASHTGVSILFPPWALPPNKYKKVVETRRDELLQHLHRRVAMRNGPDAMLFGNGPYAGKTLAQVAEERKAPYAEVLAEIGPRRTSAAYFVMDEELQNRLLLADGVNICSDGGPSIRHPRSYGSFARIIRKFVVEDKTLPLAKAVHKMSGLPAKTVGLDKYGRGTLKAGNFADILIFRPERVKDTATFSDPFQLAEGFDTVLVNGVVIRQAGEFNGRRNGRVLKRLDEVSGRPPAR